MCVSSLKIFRLKAGLTQWELAQRLGVKERVITLYETDRATPKIETMVDIARILGCDPSEIWSDVFTRSADGSK